MTPKTLFLHAFFWVCVLFGVLLGLPRPHFSKNDILNKNIWPCPHLIYFDYEKHDTSFAPEVFRAVKYLEPLKHHLKNTFYHKIHIHTVFLKLSGNGSVFASPGSGSVSVCVRVCLLSSSCPLHSHDAVPLLSSQDSDIKDVVLSETGIHDLPC